MFIIESRSEKKEDGLRGFEKKSAALSSVLTSLTEKLNILSFALASDAGDSHHGYIRPWECPPPPPALLTQDSMPRERRHLAGETWEGGSVFAFSLCYRGNVLSASMAS